MKDLDYEKIIENYNKVEELENRLEELDVNINPLLEKLGNFIENINFIIDERIKLYIENKDSNNNSIEKSQTKSVEPEKIENNNVEKSEKEKEKKLDISKFIEEFSQEFSFIDKEQFNDEMENDEIMGNIIEKIKKAFTNKENSIMDLKERVSQEIRETNILKETVSKYKNELNEKEKRILEKENEINSYKSQLENKIKENIKLEKDYNDELNLKKNEIVRLENVERILTAGKTKLEKEKKELEEKNKENSEKMKIFMTKYEEKEKELKSVGDLLEAKKLYDKYLSMETRILSKLDNVLIQRDFESFISSGYTLSSLDNVWDIVKIEYKNISKEDKETLKEVFAFFLNQINKRFKDAKYGLVQVEVGEDFDAVNQVDLSQNSKGTVTECVFYGYGFLAEKENPNDEDIIARIIKNPLVLTA
jgi:DNA ligase 1